MGRLADKVTEAPAERDAARLEAKVAEARRERDAARQALKLSEAKVAEQAQALEFIAGIEALNPKPPKWLAPRKSKAGNRATVCTILSDSHFDEVVNPFEVDGANAYNRDIATLRLKRYFERVVMMSRDYLSGVTYDGCVQMLGGDLFSGDIHEELAQTNEDTILGSILYWSELLSAGIEMLAEEFGKVHVPVVVGNHGRRTRKPRAKLRARDNYDWFLGHLLAREFKNDERVTFDVPDSADCRVNVYDTTYLLTHGDQFRGGNGIAGIWSPISRGHAKKSQRDASIGKPYDVMVMGHWHQLVWGQGFIVNGSSKGLDEYAYQGNFGFEPPQQAMWLTTPEHGITCSAPILVQDRQKERW